MLLKVCACAEITFLRQLANFVLVIFLYLSTVSYETVNFVKQFLEGRRSISSSVSKSILLNCLIIWPISLGISRRFLMLLKMQLFVFVCKISLIYLKHKSQSQKKKVSGQIVTITAAIFAFLLIFTCAEFISKYTLTQKYVNKNL